jgi:hypothetical protein
MQDSSVPTSVFNMADLPKFQPWKEIAIFAQILMELAWIVPWYRSFTYGTNAAQPWRVFGVLLIILLVTHWTVRGLNFFNLKISIRRVVMISLLIGLTLGSLRFLLYFREPLSLFELIERPVRAFGDVLVLIPDEFVIMIVVLFVAFRGISIAGQVTSPRDMIQRFQIGIAMMVLFILLNTLLTGEIPGDLLFIFLFSGLIAIGSSRMAVNERLRGGRHTPFDRRWFFALIITALVAVVTAYFAARLPEIPIFNYLVRIVTLLGSFVIGIFLLLLMPVVILLILALTWLINNFNVSNTIPQVVNNLQTALNSLSKLASQLFQFMGAYIPDISIAKPYLLWFALLGLLVLGLLWVGVSWLLQNYGKLLEEDLEPVFERRNIFQLLRYVLMRQLGNIGQRLDRRMDRFRPRHKLAAIRIRQIYQELILLSEEFGAHKLDAQTPLEYESTLMELLPDHKVDIDRITQAYIRVRYGELPEDLDEMEQLEQGWSSIQEESRRLLGLHESKESSGEPASMA